MMDRKEAIKWIKRIQSGSEVDRYLIDVPKGSIAEKLWDDTKFTFGIEYGVIIALMMVFDIGKENSYSKPKPPKSRVLAEKDGG